MLVGPITTLFRRRDVYKLSERHLHLFQTFKYRWKLYWRASVKKIVTKGSMILKVLYTEENPKRTVLSPRSR